jgi:hypothetical protein
LFSSIVVLNLALPCWKLLALVFPPPAILKTSHCLVFVPLNKCCPARCACAANAVGKDLDIFAVGAISLNHVDRHQPKIVNNICSYSYCPLLCSS